MNNQIPDVRKTVVFCMVEICESIGYQLFETEVMEKQMSLSQARLVKIYIDRRNNTKAWPAQAQLAHLKYP